MEDRERFGQAVAARDQQHPLLRLGQHDLVRRHAGLADRDLGEVDLDAAARAAGHLEGRRRQSRRAHVLDPDHGIRLEELEAGLHEELLGERVADLHRGALLVGLVRRELLGGHGRAVDAVPAGLRAHVHDGIPDALRAAAEDPVGGDDPQVHDVDQDVAVVAVMKRGLAADRRDADAVAVARDPAHDAVHEVLHPRGVDAPEPQRVQGRDRPRAHREDVAENAAHARRGALVGLDERGVVVRLHLERDGQPVADVDHPGVLARPLQDARTGGRKLLEVDARGLVGAVLAPHRREDAELDQVRLASQDLEDARVLGVGEVVLLDLLFGDHGLSVKFQVSSFKFQVRGAHPTT